MLEFRGSFSSRVSAFLPHPRGAEVMPKLQTQNINLASSCVRHRNGVPAKEGGGEKVRNGENIQERRSLLLVECYLSCPADALTILLVAPPGILAKISTTFRVIRQLWLL